ncbi:YheC/YheD family protein [Brevibacillus fluminis]|uniref:YheC/YheD family protein n=1 Tax=Brevibacillus fluminis TaxID=511487 RepID=A0A3M8DQ70_9BACL|nr:YheC/YheD family protein [Brevibacillus fluminis]RNB89575.1 YheC/YheD family protein [Brevibacillus fluminis]
MSYVRTMIQALEPRTAEQCDVAIPQSFIRQLSIPADSVVIQFGSQTHRAQVKGREAGRVVQMTPTLARSLLLPGGVPLLMRYDANSMRLIFGPYIGVLVSAYGKDPQVPFGSFTPFFNELVDISRQHAGVVSVFTFHDVDWETKTVRGMIRRNGNWQLRTLPLPQSIYNRLASRQRERSESVEMMIKRFREHDIAFFNEHFLNKWHVHKALSSVPEATEFLPKTICLGDLNDMKDMLDQHRFLYAKPANGSMGKGVYRIRRGPSGYQLASSYSAKTHKDLPSLHRALKKIGQGKNYLLQQGLKLIRSGGRTADFRVLVQKNGNGEWAVTSMVARIGAGSVVSNVARGGTMMQVKQALAVCGPWATNMKPSPQTLQRTALSVAEMLETSMGGQYAEFGIDLGVDIHGHIWLLEVNSKPSKATTSLNIPEGQEEVPRRARPSVRRLYDYAKFLGGFPKIKPTPKKRRKPLATKSLKKRNRR